MPTEENRKVVLAEFSTLNRAVLAMSILSRQIQAHPHLETKPGQGFVLLA
jgi:hypothetical protein